MNAPAATELPVAVIGAGPIGLRPDLSFLLAMTGHEQVRSVVAALAGDHEAAAGVELTLPETGVCDGAGLFDGPDAARTAAVPATRQIGLGAPTAAGGCR